jgi:hypothetical protein
MEGPLSKILDYWLLSEDAAIRKGIQDMILFFAQAFSKNLKMKQPNYTDKHPNSANILSAKRFEDRLSILITALCLLITHHCSLITDH